MKLQELQEELKTSQDLKMKWALEINAPEPEEFIEDMTCRYWQMYAVWLEKKILGVKE